VREGEALVAKTAERLRAAGIKVVTDVEERDPRARIIDNAVRWPDESAGVNYSHRSPKGNRQMRRILNQSANAAVKAKGTIFEIVYRRTVPRLGHQQSIGAIAHRQCRLIWLILHQGVRYEERGPAVTKQSK